jgi:hypothetical protein
MQFKGQMLYVCNYMEFLNSVFWDRDCATVIRGYSNSTAALKDFVLCALKRSTLLTFLILDALLQNKIRSTASLQTQPIYEFVSHYR